jgi:G3E family GTPase
MRLLLFAGFLGSGKTTLIISVARQAAEAGRRLCVIVNEIGEVGIDGEVLRVGDLEVKEITAGCICCQIGVDLVRTLRELEQEFRPDLVIIEASGIATPAGVIEALEYYPAKNVTGIETVTVIDPTRFEALHEVLTPLIEAQIAGADRLVITRADAATPAELKETTKAVRLLAPGVPVHVVDATKDRTLAVLLGDSDPAGVRA